MSNFFLSGYDIARAGVPLGPLLPPGSAIAQIYADAERRALTVRDFLVGLQEFEERMIVCARQVQATASRNLLTQTDARIYDVLTDALFTLERWLYDVLQRLVPNAIGSRLPQPIRLPYAHALAGVTSRKQLPRGFGAAPVVAVWAAAVLALLAAGAAAAIAYAFTSGDVAAEEAKQAIAVGEIKERQFTLLLERRNVAFEACLARGGELEACAEAARTLTPTPEEAGLVPETLRSGGGLGWLLPVLGVAVAGGVLYFLLANRRKAAGTVRDDDDPFAFNGLGRMARSVRRLEGPSSYYLEIPADARRR